MSHPAFNYPLSAEVLPLFCHPHPRHLFAMPGRIGSELVAANGHLVIRCHRGAWLDREFPEAGAEFLARVETLPWGRWADLRDDWRPLDEVRGSLFRRVSIGLWTGCSLTPTPVWLVAGVAVRLSMLQLIARLPRCEVYAGPIDRDEPLWFRFTGGRGAIARATKPFHVAASFSIFEPLRNMFTGERVERSKARFQGLEQPGVQWPPVDMTEEP